MKFSPRDEWFALHTQYYVDSKTSPTGLMMDAHIFLDSAHGLLQTLGDTLGDSDMVNNDMLCSALHGIATLVDMGRRCVAQADLRHIRQSLNK
jgi:hypothetical protein